MCNQRASLNLLRIQRAWRASSSRQASWQGQQKSGGEDLDGLLLSESLRDPSMTTDISPVRAAAREHASGAGTLIEKTGEGGCEGGVFTSCAINGTTGVFIIVGGWDASWHGAGSVISR